MMNKPLWFMTLAGVAAATLVLMTATIALSQQGSGKTDEGKAPSEERRSTIRT